MLSRSGHPVNLHRLKSAGDALPGTGIVTASEGLFGGRGMTNTLLPQSLVVLGCAG